MKNIYLTVLNSWYLPRALALYSSMKLHHPDLQFAFYCMDIESVRLLRALKLNALVFEEAEFASTAFLSLKKTRSVQEYCQSAKPFALCHILGLRPDADWATFIDADCLAFGNLDAPLEAAKHADYYITPHHFSEGFRKYAPSVGMFNSGYFSCRSTENGKRVAAMWRNLCFDACPAIPTDTAYTDQKYLERIYHEFPNGEASSHIGINTAPWNVTQFSVRAINGNVFIEDAPLLLYHFQALRILGKNWVDMYAGNVRLGADVRALIYMPYLAALSEAYSSLSRVTNIEGMGVAYPSADLRRWLSYVKNVLAGKSNLRYFKVI